MGNPKPAPSMTLAFFIYAFLPFISFVGLQVLEVDYGVTLSDHMTWIPKKPTTKKSKTNTRIPRNKNNKQKQKSQQSSPSSSPKQQQKQQQKIKIDSSFKVNDPRSRSKIEKPQKEEKKQNNKNRKEADGNQDKQSLYEEVSHLITEHNNNYRNISSYFFMLIF